MVAAAVGACAIGEWPEAVAVLLFYFVGEALQHRAVRKARSSIKSLVGLKPDKVRVVQATNANNANTNAGSGSGSGTSAAECCFIPTDAVGVGDVIEVLPGERVALDGVLLSAAAAFNTAALTGESMPRRIEKGGEVLAGMIVEGAVVRLRVVRPAAESAVARILRMVEEASERKAEKELFIRRFARVYTPVVFALAALAVTMPYVFSLWNETFTYHFHTWFYRALVFIVVSCPCALVVSVPLSYFAGIGAAARRGILFKGGGGLDAVHYIDTVVFDKTGTLTVGEFSVTKVEGGDSLLQTVAAIERCSNHPIAKAICRSYEQQGKEANDKDASGTAASGLTASGTPLIAANDITTTELAGYGMEAVVGGDRWLVGSLRLLDSRYIAYPDELRNVPETMVACACNGQYVGHILLADTLKADAREAVANLRQVGIRHIEILSGDKQALVDKVAAELQVDAAYGDLMPEVKVKHIRRLAGDERDLAFVGDGINDAPVIAESFVGVAMGGLGADIAIETADIVVQNDSPAKMAEAIRIGRRTHRVVNQNIVFAIGTKMAIMALGLFGIANLWLAVFADVGVTLLAVLNATRIFFGKQK